MSSSGDGAGSGSAPACRCRWLRHGVLLLGPVPVAVRCFGGDAPRAWSRASSRAGSGRGPRPRSAHRWRWARGRSSAAFSSGPLIRCVDAAAQVVPRGCGGQVGLLAGAELLQVVRGGHAGGVEEVLVLADAVGAGLVALALGGDAVDGDFGLVDGDGTEVPDLRAELVHQVHVRVQAQVAGHADHPVGLGLAVLRHELVAALGQRTVGGVEPLGPQQQVAVVEGVVAALLLGPAAGIHGLGFVG